MKFKTGTTHNGRLNGACPSPGTATSQSRTALKNSRSSAVSRVSAPGDGRAPGTQAFTLAEVLAAMVFMAILIPVAMEGLSIATRAGEVAARKSEAALVA